MIITIVFIYHYIIEKEHGVKLSKKYRDSIFEAQSKIFLNATQYLISGDKDLAIKEFLNAVDLNHESLDTYFALGKLFRKNGEIENPSMNGVLKTPYKTVSKLKEYYKWIANTVYENGVPKPKNADVNAFLMAACYRGEISPIALKGFLMNVSRNGKLQKCIKI